MNINDLVEGAIITFRNGAKLTINSVDKIANPLYTTIYFKDTAFIFVFYSKQEMVVNEDGFIFNTNLGSPFDIVQIERNIYKVGSVFRYTGIPTNILIISSIEGNLINYMTYYHNGFNPSFDTKTFEQFREISTLISCP